MFLSGAYTVLYGIALTILLPVEYFKRPTEIRNRWIRERAGRISLSQREQKGPCLWIHAVSVGEVAAAVPFIKALKARRPDLRIALSTVTDTGQKVARERVGAMADIFYMPFDLPGIISSALRRIDPALLVIMETELWPNCVRMASGRGIPVALVNGRISDRSFSGYRKVRFFMKETLGRIRLFCMQSDTYAERIRMLGAPADRVTVTGNFKFDVPAPPAPPVWSERLAGPVIIAGSTHRTEEDLVVDAYVKLLSDFPALNLIVAPRHPERFDEVEKLLKSRGVFVIRRSAIHEGDGEDIKGSVVLVDVMGELAAAYGAADIAVMGGSFIEHGGQNPLEPACWGKAIVCGPHMENFPFAEDFYRRGAAVHTDRDGLYDTLLRLLSEPDLRASMGASAMTIVRENAGATEKAVEKVIELLAPARR